MVEGELAEIRVAVDQVDQGHQVRIPQIIVDERIGDYVLKRDYLVQNFEGDVIDHHTVEHYLFVLLCLMMLWPLNKNQYTCFRSSFASTSDTAGRDSAQSLKLGWK